MRLAPDTRDPAGRRLDAWLIGLVAVLSVVSVVAVATPGFQGLTDARAVDVAINVAATLVGAAVAILAWVRWRQTGEPVDVYESAAFVAFTVVNALLIGVVLAGREHELGLAPEAPGQAPVLLWTAGRAATAGLLAIGVARSLRREQPPLPPILLAVGPTVILVVVAAMLFGGESSGSLRPGTVGLLPGQRPAVAVGAMLVLGAQVAIFGAFIAAAVLFRRLYLRDRLVSHAFMAVGLVVAAFSQLHFALDPVVASGFVTTADALRLAFAGILFMGIQAELEADLAALRRANHELRRLGEVESANAALAERTRLAREIHDGLAQDLWHAKLQQGRLAQDETLPDVARSTAREVLGAIDAALADARQAVMAMRSDPRGSTLEEVLGAYVDDFADRFGLRTEFEGNGARGRLAPRTEAEVLRIVQEALTNVRRHADATVVRVAVERPDGRVRVTVADNGRGFEPGAIGADRFGLRGMRERAEMVGAELVVDSRPADGTRIILDLPADQGTP